MAAKNLRQYIYYNMGIWLATALAAVLLIVAVRQYGTEMTARREAEDLLTEAKALLQDNAAFECQRAIEEAVRIYPPIAAQVAIEFREQLLGLPVVHARVEEVIAAAPDEYPAEAAALLHVIDEASAEALEAVADLDKEHTELYLWQARLALDQGDIPEAARGFIAYWQANTDRRQQVRRDILGPKELDAEGYAQAARRLFHAGLWAEAFTAVEQARKLGLEKPAFAYYDGVALELANRFDQAAAAYANALGLAPDFRPAQLAAKRLAEH